MITLAKPMNWWPGINRRTDVVAAFAFSEGAGLHASNLLDAENPGTLANGAFWSSDSSGYAVDINSSNDEVSTPLALPAIANGWVAWYGTHRSTGSGTAFGRPWSVDGQNNQVFFAGSSSITFRLFDNATVYSSVDIGIVFNKPSYIVWHWDGAEVNTWTNGVLKNTTSSDKTFSGGILKIGNTLPSFNRPMDGTVSMFAIGSGLSPDLHDPFFLFRPPSRIALFAPAPAAGGPFPHYTRRATELSGGTIGLGL